MGKFKDPSADFVLEVIKNLDGEDLIPIAEFITQRLQEQPVIDVDPTPSPSPQAEPVASNLNIGSLAGLLNSDTVGTLLQMFIGSNTKPAQPNPSSTSSFAGNNNLLASLPKLMQVGSEVLQQPSREERLIEAIAPFLSDQRRTSLGKLQGYMKLFGILRTLPNLLSGLNPD